MRTYPDQLTLSLRQQLGNIQLDAHRATELLKERWLQAVWRLNESEARLHAAYFEQYDQELVTNYGQRLNATDLDFDLALNAERTEHYGDQRRRYGRYSGNYYQD